MCRANNGLAGLICASVLLTTSTAVSAWNAGVELGVDARYSDNAGLNAVNETEDLITTAQAAATLIEDAGALTGNATARLRHLDYMDNTFGDQTYFTLGSVARWEQLEKRLVWTVSDYFDQTSIDNLAANTPDNTQDTNAFSLAVAATFQVADRHQIIVTPHFRDFSYDTSGIDNQQLGLAAAWNYQLDPTISLSLNGEFSDVDIEDNTTNQDYDRTSVNVAMAVTRMRSQYSASIGATKVKRDLGDETDGVSGAVSWQYDFTGRSSLIANASTDITDTSNIFLSSSIDPTTGSFNNVQASNDVVRDSVIRITYSRAGSVVNSRIWTELRDLDYDTTLLDREVQEFGANISYAISPLVTGSVSGIYLRTKEEIPASTDKEYIVDGRLSYNLSAQLTADAGVRVQTKESSGVAGREYDELSVSAAIRYRFGAR